MYKKAQRLYSQSESFLEELVDALTNKKVLRENGKMFFKGYDSPDRFSEILNEIINDLLVAIDKIAFYSLEQSSVENLKRLCAAKVEKIIISPTILKTTLNWKEEEIILYNKFRAAQADAKVSFLNAIKQEKGVKYKNRGQKFIWLGNQRQLIELFDTLIKRGWIEDNSFISQEVQALPILDMFNFRKKGEVVPINEQSFATDWKGNNLGDTRLRQKHNYSPIFDNLQENKTSKK